MPAVHQMASARSDDVVTDQQLVARCLAGDHAAERALYDAHVERVYRLAFRLAGDADLAQDFTQETFIRAFDRLSQYRGDASLATWLHTIATSVSLNGMRSVTRLRNRSASIDDVPELPAAAPRESPHDLREKLHASIDALSVKLRPVFVMHDVEGYTHEEIGLALGIPTGTSKARLFDARAKLRAALAIFAGDRTA
ncbi:MAG: polymerase sigma factor, sigma-70 family [Gemmatimonadetes bacterium]|nr:polymerase sigma factor, sigma-70 family [Gemmatimonadota bacterium]